MASGIVTIRLSGFGALFGMLICATSCLGEFKELNKSKRKFLDVGWFCTDLYRRGDGQITCEKVPDFPILIAGTPPNSGLFCLLQVFNNKVTVSVGSILAI